MQNLHCTTDVNGTGVCSSAQAASAPTIANSSYASSPTCEACAQGKGMAASVEAVWDVTWLATGVARFGMQADAMALLTDADTVATLFNFLTSLAHSLFLLNAAKAMVISMSIAVIPVTVAAKMMAACADCADAAVACWAATAAC